jgi:hypothetical protein
MTQGHVWRNTTVLILDCHAWVQARNDGEWELRLLRRFAPHNDTMASLQDFSVALLHDNEAQMKPTSGAYVLVRERARRNCNEVSVQKNKLKIVKD